MVKHCSFCGKNFETTNKRQIYCSANCRNKAYYRSRIDKIRALNDRLKPFQLTPAQIKQRDKLKQQLLLRRKIFEDDFFFESDFFFEYFEELIYE